MYSNRGFENWTWNICSHTCVHVHLHTPITRGSYPMDYIKGMKLVWGILSFLKFWLSKILAQQTGLSDSSLPKKYNAYPAHVF